MQFPTVIGGVVPIVNLPGVKPGQLKITGPVLADIYRGGIELWDDPHIAAFNPGVKLPHMKITVVHRADGSGTSFLFTTYLSMKGAAWKSQVGAGESVNWPTGVGGKGNDGVAAAVADHRRRSAMWNTGTPSRTPDLRPDAEQGRPLDQPRPPLRSPPPRPAPSGTPRRASTCCYSISRAPTPGRSPARPSS